MIAGDIRNQVDRIWDAFWSGGISNPLEVIEQITYLLFLRHIIQLIAQGYDLSINRYKEVVHEEVAHRSPQEILANLVTLEKEIQHGMKGTGEDRWTRFEQQFLRGQA